MAFESWRHGIHVWPVFISAGLPESAAAIERLAAFSKPRPSHIGRRILRGDRAAVSTRFPDKEAIGLTSTKADRQAHESGVSVDVVAIVVRVSDLDRSLKFYCDVFSCRVAVREADMALLLTPKGFEI